MLGGSIGIAMSTALLASTQRGTGLFEIVPPAALQDLESGMNNLTSTQRAAVRSTYNTAFTGTMRICAIVAGIGILLSMGTYRRNRTSLVLQREEKVREEITRRQIEQRRKQEPSSSNSSRRST